MDGKNTGRIIMSLDVRRRRRRNNDSATAATVTRCTFWSCLVACGTWKKEKKSKKMLLLLRGIKYKSSSPLALFISPARAASASLCKHADRRCPITRLFSCVLQCCCRGLNYCALLDDRRCFNNLSLFIFFKLNFFFHTLYVYWITLKL